MGTPKAALPLSDTFDTFISRIVRTLRAAGLPDIVVVTGAAEHAVQAAAGTSASHVRFVHNAHWTAGQLSSFITGLDAESLYGAAPVEAALMTLVDVPLATAETTTRVLHAWRATRAPIVRPARGDQHGHPVIFDRSLFDALRAADPRVGAKAVVRAHAAEILNVSVDDPGAFLDIDTTDEYRAAVRGLSPRH
jgi:molybdenum cofactor cytidylyltransferase